MNTPLLEIVNLHASVEGKPILKGFNLTINKGSIHAIMGPNGAGKSTLAKVLSGHPSYEVTEGHVFLEGVNILEMDPEERALNGLFMSFQYPQEISGVSNSLFLKTAYNAKRKHASEKEVNDEEFALILNEKMQLMEMKEHFKDRSLNEGFSGGEKKRNEILQMALLDPKISILDETDSGLDIDAMRIVASGVNKIMDTSKALIVITHYQRLLDYLKPDFVHVMMDGAIFKSGSYELASELEARGYK
jgi:Fe-S cluster assembly ATP-binding protein